jgi:hypothetical protein
MRDAYFQSYLTPCYRFWSKPCMEFFFAVWLDICLSFTFWWLPCRKRLFSMINSLPTVYEAVTGNAKKESKEKTPKSNSKSNKSGSKVWNFLLYCGSVLHSGSKVWNLTRWFYLDIKHCKTQPSRQSEPNSKGSKMQPPKDEEESEGEEQQDDQDTAVCGACFKNNGQDLFWICCDLCEKWFHGACVKITPAKAEHIKQYKCPSCSTSSKRAKPSA